MLNQFYMAVNTDHIGQYNATSLGYGTPNQAKIFLKNLLIASKKVNPAILLLPSNVLIALNERKIYCKMQIQIIKPVPNHSNLL